MDEVKRVVVEWWLRTILLPFLGRRFPDFLQAVCQDLGFSERDRRLIYLRYTLKKGWKEIAPLLCVEERQVHNLHKNCIYRLTLPQNQ